MNIDVEREAKRVLYHLKHAQWQKLPATLTVEQWLARINQFDGLCAYCLELPFEALDHLIPTTADGGTVDGNCFPVCTTCNCCKTGRVLCDTSQDVSIETRLNQVRQALKNRVSVPRIVKEKEAPDDNSAGETVTFHLSKRDVEVLQRFLERNGEDPTKWRKAARRYAKEGVYSRIKAYLDAIIL